MFMGRLSNKWNAAVSLYFKIANDTKFSTTWTSQAMAFLWKYTRSLWNHRNTVVHGATDQDIFNKIGATIAEK